MSDPGSLVVQERSPLRVGSYFDEALFAAEMQAIFAHRPHYLGHRLAVPRPGDYQTLAQEGDGRMLVNTADHGIRLLSNVCRHRQAIMYRGRGALNSGAAASESHLVCPIHRWTYRDDGTLIGAPGFEDSQCRHLSNEPVQAWNGLLFETGQRDVAADLAGMERATDLDFSGYVFDRLEVHECDYNWKTFIEVYLEDYHVAPFHPGLGQFVTCGDLAWQFSREYSVQTVGVSPRLGTAGSAVYQRWHESLMRYQRGRPLPYGAVWLTYYPTLMVEWYPHTLTVSSLVPVSPQKTLNLVEFFYIEEVAAFEREFVQAQQAAYRETMVEDDEIGRRMDDGRLALLRRGSDDVGPYQSPMEDGMRHFHAWYRQQMAGHEGLFLNPPC